MNIPLTIEIAGRDEAQCNAVAAVVADHLTQSGFTDVTLNTTTETAEAESAMDLINRSYPELLSTPVEVNVVDFNAPQETVIDVEEIIEG
jgi:hypothetical protein